MELIALYDENCSLCQNMKRKFEKIDVFHKINWVSLQQYEMKNQSHSFQAIHLRKELHLIQCNGKVLKGFRAIRKILFMSPYTFLLGAVLYIPFSPIIGDPIYRLVAKNRLLFNKKNCDSGQCSIK